MCVYSMIMDHYTDKWEKYKTIPPNPITIPLVPDKSGQLPSAEEIAEFYKLLERAREYDKKNNEPDCELDSKKEKLRILAEELGVKIEFVE